MYKMLPGESPKSWKHRNVTKFIVIPRCRDSFTVRPTYKKSVIQPNSSSRRNGRNVSFRSILSWSTSLNLAILYLSNGLTQKECFPWRFSEASKKVKNWTINSRSEMILQAWTYFREQNKKKVESWKPVLICYRRYVVFRGSMNMFYECYQLYYYHCSMNVISERFSWYIEH